MIVTAKLERVFLFKHNQQERTLSDPSANFSPQEVMNFYAGTYPILTTSKIEGPEIKDDRLEYCFITTLGTKG